MVKTESSWLSFILMKWADKGHILISFFIFSGSIITRNLYDCLMKTSLLLIAGILFFSTYRLEAQYSRRIDESASIQKKDIFPLQSQHVHGSTLVELSNGDILIAWFQGSGERQADDVAIMGARWTPGDANWSKPFIMADYHELPDVNPVLYIDPADRLWLIWYTVLANQWETAILKYRISDDYLSPGPPRWAWQEDIHLKPGRRTERGIQPDDPFVVSLTKQIEELEKYLSASDMLQQLPEEQQQDMMEQYRDRTQELIAQAKGKDMMARGYVLTDENRERQQMGYPRFRRMGWQTRNKPFIVDNRRMLLPLYSDGFDFSLMAITDDWGKTWTTSKPIFGLGSVQPAMLEKTDGAIVAYMRDNGPPPQRLLMSTSTDKGITWSVAKDSEIPNPGSAADVVELSDGTWLMVHNDTEDERYSLAVTISQNEGKNWATVAHIEQSEPGTGRYHYPAVIEGKDGKIHVSYSYHINHENGQAKNIRHAWFKPFWE